GPLGGVMRGGTIGRVVNSKHPDYSEGDTVMGAGGWQDYSVFGPKGLPRKLPGDSSLPLTNHMSVLGGTGLTAYFGLLDVCEPKPGDTVVVSAASGGVGLAALVRRLAHVVAMGAGGVDLDVNAGGSELGTHHRLGSRAAADVAHAHKQHVHHNSTFLSPIDVNPLWTDFSVDRVAFSMQYEVDPCASSRQY
ncbi:MAG: hypothetical protein IIB38_16915, partial [Candidatus Hydrogenedentes bacterium]|nr:hypothetical protein [Candidatus Hydrogenedentota bacterium]